MGHLGYVGLHEERGPLGIEAQGQQVERRVERIAAQLGRFADRGQGMHVGNEVKGRFRLVLQIDVLADRAEIVAPVKTAGGLNAGKHAWHGNKEG